MQTIDKQPCYLLIYLLHAPHRVITFPSIKQAYTFAKEYVLNNTGLFDYWHVSLANIYDDIKTGELQEWAIVQTYSAQLFIGLGNDIPLNSKLVTDYTLESHDNPNNIYSCILTGNRCETV